jgi:multiple sugar transport system permease protein
MLSRWRNDLVSWLVVGPFAIVLAFPFYWMLMTSFKTNGDLYNVQNVPFVFNKTEPNPMERLPLKDQDWLPLGIENVTTSNYEFVFKDTKYVDWLQNTALVGLVVVLITLMLALPAGYALARLSGPWGQSAGVGIFLTYLVPPTLLFLPLSRVVAELGLQDRLWSLIVVYPSFTVPFSTWLLMGFFKTIPPELEDAALIDGASRLKALVRVVFPISLPGILTVVIFSFSLVVNEFIYAVTFISTSDARTVSSGVPLELIRGDVYFWQSLMAAALIPAIPLALLYNAFLDRFIAGFTGGAFR